MHFQAPLFLLLLIPIFAGLYLSHRQMMGMTAWRKRLASIIRGALATLLVLALALPQILRPNRGLATIIVLDRSDSIPESARKVQEEFVRELFSQLGDDDFAGVVVAGAHATMETVVAGRRPFGQVLSKIDSKGTDLSAAVRLAVASFPEGKGARIVLLTDGNETQGDLVAAAEIAATDGVAIDFVPIKSGNPGEALVSALEAPTQQAANEPFSLRALVESATEQTATLRLERSGVLVDEKTIRLPAGKSAVLFQDRLAKSGFFQYNLILRADKDADIRNNVAGAFVSVLSRPRILLAQMDNEPLLANALRAQGIDVDLRTPGGIPTRAHQFQNYAGIIFNDFNATALTPQQMSMIQQAIRDTGIGFTMIGGEHSFLPGGYYGTPIADALPVDLDIRNRKSFPSTSILIIVDASGSMSMIEDGVQKIRLAAQAAEYTVKLLSPADRVGVGGSSDGLEMVAPMQPLTNKEAVIAQVRRLSTGGGGIYIGMTVKKAQEMLMAENSKVRHFILLADGNDSEDPQDALARIMAMRADKITTTVVSIGDGQDVPLLKNVASAGGGRFFMAKRASQLPAIFTQDTSLVARSAIEEGEFLPETLVGDPMTRGIDRAPSLLAYCLSEIKPLARLAMRTHKKDPLLASWQYGLGTTVAFTSDAHARWAANWTSWNGFGPFWAQVARNANRLSGDSKYQVSIDAKEGRPMLSVEAQDRLGNPRTDWDGKMRIGAPDGNALDVQLTQVAPGSYRAPFDRSGMGSYTATVAEGGAAGQTISVTGFNIAYPPEFRSMGSSTAILERAAEVSGGKGIKNPTEALRPMTRPGIARSSLWPLLLTIAIFALLVDVCVRRVSIPLAEIFQKLRMTRAERIAVGAESKQEDRKRTDRLREAKTRAKTPTVTIAAPFELGEDRSTVVRTPDPEPVASAPTMQSSKTESTVSATLLEKRRQKKAESELEQPK